MKIAYVLGTSSGGTGAHVAMLAEGFLSAGREVTVFAPEDTGRRFFGPAMSAAETVRSQGTASGCPDGQPAADVAAADTTAAGTGQPCAARGAFRLVPVDIADRPRPARDAVAVARLRGEFRRWHPAVVHAHGLRAGALVSLALAGPAAATPRPALVVTVHNAPVTGGLTGAVYATLEWLTARRADAVTCVSPDLEERMRRRGARLAGRALVPAPPTEAPSPAAVAAARESLGGPGRPLVLAVGRLAPQKGYGVLLAAAATWSARQPVPLAAVAGDGPLAGALAAQARAEGADVMFLGQRGDVPALLAAADVVVLPSLWEGQSLALQEALRAGRPVVATRVGGIRELTGEDGALLVQPGDPVGLARAVTAVLDDPGLAARLSAAALVRAAALPTPATATAAAAGLYQHLTTAADLTLDSQRG